MVFMRRPETRSGCSRLWRAVFVALFSFAIPVTAEIPSVDYLFPAGGQTGATFTVTASGKLTPWPLGVWTDSPGLDFKPGPTNGQFTVSIATHTPPGPHLVRFYNSDGASGPKLFVVGTWNEVNEPKLTPTEPFSITNLPVIVNGRFEKGGDSDSFAIQVTKDHSLIARVQSYGLDSPVDPVLQLTDPDGTQLAFNHDSRTLDPTLVFRAPKTGTYLLQLFAFAFPPRADINFFGADAAVYRLSLTTGPSIAFAFPAGISRQHTSTVHLFGWNLPSDSGAALREIDPANIPPTQSTLCLPLLDAGEPLALPIGQWPETREIEPNNAVDLAQPVEIPCTVNGRIDPTADVDRFRFKAKKGERLIFRLHSVRLGFPLDGVIGVEDDSGKSLARSEPNRVASDPELAWTVPQDGAYVVSLTDLIHRGNSNYVYRLELCHPTPDFKVAVENDAYRVEPGKSVSMKVTLTRSDALTDKIVVAAENLPAGVAATSAEASKSGELHLTLSAAPDAKPVNQPFRVLAILLHPQTPQMRTGTAGVKAQNSRHLLITETEQIWLTVLPGPPPQEKDKTAAK